MSVRGGILVISLDFELHWGVLPSRSVESYRENLMGVRTVVPALLDLFAEHAVRATWAVVGFLFFKTRADLLHGLPRVRPDYGNPSLDPYRFIEEVGVGADERSDPFHFAPSLIEAIRGAGVHEIGTHTFSHYYCLEPGQDEECFAADLDAAIAAAAPFGIRLRSIVLPRNQLNPAYAHACTARGITCHRGTEPSWLYHPRPRGDETPVIRALRLADAYLPFTTDSHFPPAEVTRSVPRNVRASRFLRPYAPRRRALEPLRLRRIQAEMTHAARLGHVYHLWWHPHNFGRHIPHNLAFLAGVLSHFSRLRRDHGMESLTMSQAAERAAGLDSRHSVPTP